MRYPTLCLSIDIKKDPKGVKRLFRRCQSLKVASGRFDVIVYLVDETSDLYAVSKHLILDYVKQKSDTARRFEMVAIETRSDCV